MTNRSIRTPSPSSSAWFGLPEARLRLATGLILFIYIASHLSNHALGLISLSTAEYWLRVSVAVWQSWPGTLALYSAATLHIFMALTSVYRHRTLLLPVAEWVRFLLGFWMPLLLIGHVTATRLEAEFSGAAPTYARIVASMWASNSEWRQMGLLAPGWVHGCMGLNFAFRHTSLWQKLRLPLFCVALLLPVLSALGFITMARQLESAVLRAPPTPVVSAPSPSTGPRATDGIRDGLLLGYISTLGLVLAARALRGVVERRRKGVVTIRYPSGSVSVPTGWSVLDASRALHLVHASRCGGKGRCSTCRILVTAGAESCPPPRDAEIATLRRIGAAADVRLACQLRPVADVSVVPLVHADAAAVSVRGPGIDAEGEVVVLYCDFINRKSLSDEHLSQDLMFVFTRYVEAISAAIRVRSGRISFVGHNGICALFGITGEISAAALNALAAAAIIEDGLEELNATIGRQLGIEANIGISIDAGIAVMSDIGIAVETIIASGPVFDSIDHLRDAIKTHRNNFAVSARIFSLGNLTPPASQLPSASSGSGSPYYVLDDASSWKTLPFAAPTPGPFAWVVRKSLKLRGRH